MKEIEHPADFMFTRFDHKGNSGRRKNQFKREFLRELSTHFFVSIFSFNYVIAHS